MSELHEAYAPTASATNVRNVNSNIKSPGTNAATGNVANSEINSPDNENGSSTVVTENESQGIVVTSTAVNGRLDQFTVINNPA